MINTKQVLAKVILDSCIKNYKVEDNGKCYFTKCIACFNNELMRKEVEEKGCILYLHFVSKKQKKKILKQLQKEGVPNVG